MRAVDCEALAGAWDLGSVREGFEIAHRVALPGGFGNEMIETNRALLGEFEIETGGESTWTAQHDIAFMFGTPPCSGWSVMNTSKGAGARGSESVIQQCTWGLIHYASRTWGSDGKLGPEIVSFECVQQAYTQGRNLMTAYARTLRERTGQPYDVTHVMMSGSSVGAAQYRPRYFFVAHRIPFGVDVVSPRRPATYADAIGDLIDHRITDEFQPYRSDPTAYVQVHGLQNPRGEFDLHIPIVDGSGGTNLDLTINVLEMAGDDWHPGEYQRDVIERLFAAGKLPERARKWVNPDTGKAKGWGGPRRVVADRAGFVIHGGGPGQFIHYVEDRWLTVRELARLMGYPDVWRFPPGARVGQIGAWLGKNCPVTSGQWLSHWAAESLRGRPGSLRGAITEPDIGRLRETTINVSHAYKGPERIVAA